jgi:tetratricopeptide (TPR) repeat protein
MKLKEKSFRILAVTLPFYFYLFTFLSGCSKGPGQRRPEDYARQSEAYYQLAVSGYRDLIKKGGDLDRLYLALGRLYYENGKFQLAVEAFKQSNTEEAHKFLAISCYRLGNFTDALEVFNRYKIPDDEYIYYQGLACEKMNLFDQALQNYKTLAAGGKFKAEASQRIEAIERKPGTPRYIKDISPRVYQILSAAPLAEAYPQAGALILSCEEKIEVTAADTQVSTLHYIVKILNERGKEDFSEAQIEYDSTYEKVELEYARTIKPDGQVAEVGSRHIRDVSKYLNFPLYSNARIFIISFPEITEGASIEYKVKVLRNQLINKRDFVSGYPLQTSEPVISASFSLSLPKEKTIHFKTLGDNYNDFGANLKPDRTEEKGFVTYSWGFKDIPQIIPEPGMPPEVRINPTILISTFNSWQEVYDWWWPLAKDKIVADPAIKARVKELIQGKGSDEEKARAIYNFCAQKIRYVAVEYGQAGYEPHKAEDIFRNKYGDCKDQAILLVTMLREAGLSSLPVLIATDDYYNLNDDFPATLFDHCIACLFLKDKTIFLDPTAQTCPFGDLPGADQGRRVLVCGPDGFKILQTPLFAAQHNSVLQKFRIKINEDETITAEKSIFSRGVYDQGQRYWLLYTRPQLIEETLKQKIQEVSIGARLNGYKIENLNNLNEPVVLSYGFSGPEYFTAAGSLRIMPQLAAVDMSLIAKDKRRYPIDFAMLDSKETIFEVAIPQNFVIKYIPESVCEDSPWFKFIAEYKQKSGTIYFRQGVELKKVQVCEEEYPVFKSSIEALAKRIKQRVVLERKD